MSDYQQYATTLVKDVLPSETLKGMVNVFMIDAGTNMGSDFTDKTLDRVIEIVQAQFKFLPVCYIASAFKKGSLGDYGAGRLVPRTIYGWLNEISLEYNREQAHKAIPTDTYSNAYDLNKYPVGSAIIKKIEWVRTGIMTMDEWDRVPLKTIAELIKRNGYVTYDMI